MDFLSLFSVLLVTLGLHISSVHSVECNDISPSTYTCFSGKCCYGTCCSDNSYCCGRGSCCLFTQPSNELPTSATIAIVVGSVIIGLCLIAGIIALCCMCFRTSKRGHVMSNHPQYAQQPYDVNSQYDQMAQQPYPTLIQYPTVPPVQPQQAAYIPPVDYEQRRHPERPRRHHSIPRARY